MSSTGYHAHETAVIDEGARIGDGTRIWHFSHVMPDATIGHNCTLGQNVYVANHVTIGDHCKIQNNVSIYEGVTLEDYVFCGPSMVFTNVRAPRSEYPQDASEGYERTLVKRGASIGANATIVCGITLHEYAFVAAGAVVTKDVPAYAVVSGVPARHSGWMSEAGHILSFDQADIATDEYGHTYRLQCGKYVERVS